MQTCSSNWERRLGNSYRGLVLRGWRTERRTSMTIGGWCLVGFGWLIVVVIAIIVCIFNCDRWWAVVPAIVIAIGLCIGIYAAGKWYYTSTASGIRAMTDQQSELANGLERTITVYTADGGKIAEYHGRIDLEMDQDYIKFDWKGKRYIYYNCFVETIAEIP